MRAELENRGGVEYPVQMEIPIRIDAATTPRSRLPAKHFKEYLKIVNKLHRSGVALGRHPVFRIADIHTGQGFSRHLAIIQRLVEHGVRCRVVPDEEAITEASAHHGRDLYVAARKRLSPRSDCDRYGRLWEWLFVVCFNPAVSPSVDKLVLDGLRSPEGRFDEMGQRLLGTSDIVSVLFPPSTRADEVEIPDSATVSASRFQLAPPTNPRDAAADTTHRLVRDAPLTNLRVLDTTGDWLVVLVPGWGRAWVRRGHVLEAFNAPVENPVAHCYRLSHLVLSNVESAADVLALLCAVGSSLANLGITQSVGFSEPLSDTLVRSVFEACPFLEGLEIDTTGANELASLSVFSNCYADGVCRAKRLSLCAHCTRQDPRDYRLFECLADSQYPLFHHLEDLALTLPSAHGYEMHLQALPLKQKAAFLSVTMSPRHRQGISAVHVLDASVVRLMPRRVCIGIGELQSSGPFRLALQLFLRSCLEVLKWIPSLQYWIATVALRAGVFEGPRGHTRNTIDRSIKRASLRGLGDQLPRTGELRDPRQAVLDWLARAFDEEGGQVEPRGRGYHIVFFDGGSRGNPGPGGAGAVVVETDQDAMNEKVVWSACMSYAQADMTNNRAEYLGAIDGLKAARDRGWKVQVVGDSSLILRQLHE